MDHLVRIKCAWPARTSRGAADSHHRMLTTQVRATNLPKRLFSRFLWSGPPLGTLLYSFLLGWAVTKIRSLPRDDLDGRGTGGGANHRARRTDSSCTWLNRPHRYDRLSVPRPA